MFETLPVRVVTCSFGTFFNSLNEKDRVNLQHWLDADWISNQELLRQIQAEAKVSFGKDTMAAHRKGECRCSTQ